MLVVAEFALAFILVNETLARQYYPNDDPTTKRHVTGVLDPQQTLSEIVGVVGDVHEMGLDVDVAPTFYFISSGPVMALLMRTRFGSHVLSRICPVHEKLRVQALSI